MNANKWLSCGAVLVVVLMLSGCEDAKVDWYAGQHESRVFISSPSQEGCQRTYDRLKSTLNKYGYKMTASCLCGNAWTGEGLAAADVTPTIDVDYFDAEFSWDISVEERARQCNEKLQKSLSDLIEDHQIILSVKPCSFQKGDLSLDAGQIAFIPPKNIANGSVN